MSDVAPELWDRLESIDLSEIAERNNCRIVDGKFLEIDIVNQIYHINLDDRKMFHVGDSDPAGQTHRTHQIHQIQVTNGELIIASLAYLFGAVDREPLGSWVSPKSFPAGQQFFAGPHSLPTAEIADKYGSDPDGFNKACQAIGGEALQFADSSFKIPFFRRLPVAVLLWIEDDEFPARVDMMLDATANDHLPLDALLACMSTIQKMLVVGP